MQSRHQPIAAALAHVQELTLQDIMSLQGYLVDAWHGHSKVSLQTLDLLQGQPMHMGKDWPGIGSAKASNRCVWS